MFEAFVHMCLFEDVEERCRGDILNRCYCPSDSLLHLSSNPSRCIYRILQGKNPNCTIRLILYISKTRAVL